MIGNCVPGDTVCRYLFTHMIYSFPTLSLDGSYVDIRHIFAC
jgi:hypothetical protein